MKTNEPNTSLHQWMKKNRYTDRLFAERISEMVSPRSVGPRSVFLWRHGKVMPRAHLIDAIGQFTGGAVPAQSFIDAALGVN